MKKGEKDQNIVLFDMDGTLSDYDKSIQEELYKIKLETEKRIRVNYYKYVLVPPIELFRHIRDGLIYKKYLFKAGVRLYNFCKKIGFFRSNDVEIQKRLKRKSLEYNL